MQLGYFRRNLHASCWSLSDRSLCTPVTRLRVAFGFGTVVPCFLGVDGLLPVALVGADTAISRELCVRCRGFRFAVELDVVPSGTGGDFVGPDCAAEGFRLKRGPGTPEGVVIVEGEEGADELLGADSSCGRRWSCQWCFSHLILPMTVSYISFIVPPLQRKFTAEAGSHVVRSIREYFRESEVSLVRCLICHCS